MTAAMLDGDVITAGYVIVPDGEGFTVLAPPLGPCEWVGNRGPGTRELVAEECPTVTDAWTAALDHLEAELTARWCDRCGDQAVCPECAS